MVAFGEEIVRRNTDRSVCATKTGEPDER